jgi:hypothetical protein
MNFPSNQLVFHGGLLLLIGLLGGFFFARAIKSGVQEVAWRVVHSGSTMAGIMLIALAPVAPKLVLPAWATLAFAWSIIGGSDVFVVAMVIAAFTGGRGLSRGGTAANRLVLALYQAGTVLSLIACVLLVIGAAHAL